MVHVAIVIHGVAGVGYHNHSTIVKLSITLCPQLILSTLLMLVRRREHSKLISSTLIKTGMVIKFVL